ncbi:VanZ family protein [Paraconexibacter sp.]|uniref:VanZ family protein n=1 Tax=Paraconexibacter sp. TaxID=2949640 RepID=UPI003564299B
MALVGRFAPPLALMALIFALSAQPDLSSGLGTWDLVLRKLAHMTEYGLLWFLWLRALGRPARPLAAAAIAIAYAASDEWHQTFVEGRHGTPVDVLIDATGVLIASALWRRRLRASRAPSP